MRQSIRSMSVLMTGLVLLAVTAGPAASQEADAGCACNCGMHQMHGQKDGGMQGMGGAMLGGISEKEKEALVQGAGLGAGMLAMSNGYPGPKHVLEMGDDLGLTADQRETIGTIYGEGKARFVELGTDLVEKEQELAAMFASGSVDTGDVEDLARDIGEIRGTLRAAHLNAHVETYEALSPEQREKAISMHGMHHESGQGMRMHQQSGQGS